MPKKTRIRLVSLDPEKLNYVCEQIKDIVKKTGVKMSGPIPLPTRRLKVPVMRNPSGEGTKTWDKYEMRVHKRIIDLEADERTMRQLMRIRLPEEVYIEVELK